MDIIRPAKPQEADILTVLARKSNRFWDYPEEYHAKWDMELKMLPNHITQNLVYVAEQSDEIIGYFSIVHIRRDCQIGNRFVNKGHWLENLFVLPKYIRKGFGAALVQHAKILCKEKGVEELYAFVEPCSNGFYDKMGGQLIRESPTEFNGRVIPVYLLPI